MQFEQKYRGGQPTAGAGAGGHNSETETESEPVDEDLSPIKIVSDLEVKMLGGTPARRRLELAPSDLNKSIDGCTYPG